MDLSFNKINKINQKNVSFQGLKGDYNSSGAPVYKFIPPPFNQNKEFAVLQIVPLEENAGMAGFREPKEHEILEFNFDGNKPLEISQDKFNKANKSSAFAYRYKISLKDTDKSRFEIDKFKTINIAGKKGVMNLIDRGETYGISPKAGPMRHSFLDSDVILNSKGQMTSQDAEFVRNHFNKLGGNIKGLTYLLKNTDELNPYRYVMTTPDIGADNTSSHRYWPNNQYQCSNIDDFKEFNYELFKRGKGYVADGAFTSQSLQSPFVQHILKWGDESPYYNMLKVNGELGLGILPDRNSENYDEIFSHIGVKLVNSPKSDEYDDRKPTYIQFFDDRLSSAKQQNSQDLIMAYDKKLDDHYEIMGHQDSVQPYYFELPISSKKIKEFGDKNAILLKDVSNLDEFLTFPKFKIAQKAKVSGAAFWDGNTDIIKMNLSNPGKNPAKIKGMLDAKEYVLGVATFWSEAIQSDFILNLAKAKQDERKTIALNNDLSLEQFEAITKDAEFMDSLVIKQDKSLYDYLDEFPYQSIETSPELSAIFAQPKFRDELYAKGFEDTIVETIENVLNEVIPERYQNDDEYKAFVIKTYANTIIKTLFAGSMAPDAIEKDGKIKTEELRNVTLKTMLHPPVGSPDIERRQVVEEIKSAFNPSVLSGLQNKIEKELKNISLEDFMQAEQIVLLSKAGLNWRFDAAKDIGDLDAIRSGNTTFDAVWNGEGDDEGVQAFWTDFVSRIRACNPSSYVINEITTLPEFYVWNDVDSMYDFDEELAKEYLSKVEKDPSYGEDYENNLPYAKEMQFIEKTSSTTDSNYDKYFNNLSGFIGLDPEHGEVKERGDVAKLKEQTQHFLKFAQPNTAMYSHVFVENHDKPRVLHVAPLDTVLYLRTDLTDESNKKYRALATKLTGGRTDYKNISPKAVAVAQAMSDTIDKLSYSAKEKQELKSALQDLTNGKDKNGKNLFKRAEAFGVLPYEVTIRDLFKKSGIKYDDNDILKFHYEMLKDGISDQEKMWQVTCALVGVPTLFNGMEFAQTGYETGSKNIYVGNRNQVLHDLKDVDGYKEYYNKMQAITSLYKEPDMSALRGGFPIILEDGDIKNPYAKTDKTDQGKYDYFVGQIKAFVGNGDIDEKFKEIRQYKPNTKAYHDFLNNVLNIGEEYENHEIFPKVLDDIEKTVKHDSAKFSFWSMFKYDEFGSKTISVISNYGVKQNGDCQIESIPIRDENGRAVLDEGTILKRKIYADGKFKDDGNKYIVKDGAIVAQNGKIRISDTVANFYVPKKTYF